ncbi:MAG: DUF2218 domain-containing protein [Catenulispora sp.]|nr:DUF2218 domain-containing protein [Catenulispora sp.]
MPTARATVATDRATRYLAQLSSHTDHIGHIGRSLLQHRGSHARPAVEAVSDTSVRIRLGAAQCDVTADPVTLTFRATAQDPEQLRRLQEAVTRTVERIGRRDRLAVIWESTGSES